MLINKIMLPKQFIEGVQKRWGRVRTFRSSPTLNSSSIVWTAVVPVTRYRDAMRGDALRGRHQRVRIEARCHVPIDEHATPPYNDPRNDLPRGLRFCVQIGALCNMLTRPARQRAAVT